MKVEIYRVLRTLASVAPNLAAVCLSATAIINIASSAWLIRGMVSVPLVAWSVLGALISSVALPTRSFASGVGTRNRLAVGFVGAFFVPAITCTAAYLCFPRPVMELHEAYPTTDKAQSKIWHGLGYWWAWLPWKSGSALWRREGIGRWTRELHDEERLWSFSGSADVWSNGATVGVVAHDGSVVRFARLDSSGRGMSYELTHTVELSQPILTSVSGLAKSATLSRDRANRWWVSVVQDGKVWVVHSDGRRGLHWSAPTVVAESLTELDKSLIFEIPDGIGVIWAVQNNDDERVLFRSRSTKMPLTEWGSVEVLAQGADVAEDHFNAALGANGTVYVVTMDDRNVVGEPQLVLRTRGAHGQWRAFPFADRSATVKPTRAITMVSDDPQVLYVVHNRLIRNGRKVRGDLVVRCTFDPRRIDSTIQWPLLSSMLPFDVRDPTATKQLLQNGDERIVLASDKFGRVFEATIDVCVPNAFDTN